MNPQPKPTPKPPKPRKPISRRPTSKKSVIQKTKAKARKRTHKTPRCEVLRCHKPQDVTWGESSVSDFEMGHAITQHLRGMCRSHARQEALTRWSFSIRTGRCELAGFHAQYNVRCAGANVAGHGFGKGAYPGVMFEPWNGFSKCSGLNAWVEDHTLEWDGYLREAWGDQYEERRRRALQVRKYDLAEVLTRFPAVPKREKEAA